MKLKIFTVDAFSEQPFKGNPAAVIPLDQNLPESLMQKIAFELNLSETAFVTPVATGSASSWQSGSRFGLRWFTPSNEVPLCGHATLATAHTLFHSFGNTTTELEFETLSGVLLARKQENGIALGFPSNPPKPLNDVQQQALSPLIRLAVGEKSVKEVALSPSTRKLLIRLDDSHTRDDLESMKVETERLLHVHDGSEVRGIILTLLGDLHLDHDSGRGLKDHHFVSRYFAPWVGISEDPVTGSAHTVLAPYWHRQLGSDFLKCRQCSPRGGELTLRVRENDRIDIIGKAATVIEGYINV